ncbi:MAG: hypothetical protein JWO02_4179 [Solirubrobacterales bacterium]|nr:hypothetical protein [Solirubrobacterales bacterium]
MSTPPEAPPAPAVHASTDATRGKHLRSLLRGRTWQLSTALATIAGVVAGAASGTPLIALGALVGMPLVALLVAFAIASSRASKDFWTAFAASLGMTYVGEKELPHATPILGEGDRRSCTDWMEGHTAEGRSFGLGNYTYETRERDSDGEGYHYEGHDFTLAVIDVADADACFVSAVSVREHHRNKVTRFFSEDAIDSFDGELLPTESAVFDGRYDLTVGKGEDKVRVLEIFSPSFLARLAEHPLEPYLDYRDGTLVVFTEKHSDEAAEFSALLAVTNEIAQRFQEEIAESVRAGQSVAPR